MSVCNVRLYRMSQNLDPSQVLGPRRHQSECRSSHAGLIRRGSAKSALLGNESDVRDDDRVAVTQRTG